MKHIGCIGLGLALALVLVFAMPAQAQTYTRTEVITYFDDTSKWVLGQVQKTTVDGAEVSRTEFDANALPWKHSEFTLLKQTLTYDTTSAVDTGQRGTLKTVTDGNNNVTTLTNWKRGVPQSIKYPVTAESPGGAVQSAVVSDDGTIASVTDENGYKTCYGYDAMGRLAKITYPSETQAGVCDESAWSATTLSFASGYPAAYGLPAGHWRQQVITGNGLKETLYDAMWRPVVTQTYDKTSSATISATISQVINRYDSSGHISFVSYPQRTLDAAITNTWADPAVTPNAKGTFTAYDALDRVTEVKQNWEHDATLGLLTTRTDYLDGFRTQVTNPRSYASITSYKAYDQPTTDWPTAIAYPSIGAYVDIERDVYGKPLSLTRRNVSSTLATTRTYLYGGAQRLCVVTEPETGSTVSVFDGAGNLAWTASGLVIPAGTSCADAKAQASASGRVVNRTYDARNRIKTLTFPDGRGNQAWTYTADGLPDQVTAYNASGNTQPVTTDYTYNRHRLLTQERLLERNWALTYNYNVNGHLSSHVLPGSEVVAYAPNALGQATKVSGNIGGDFATDVTYHPDGTTKTFTYGNGISHTLGRNARGLPSLNQDFYVDTAGATVKILKDEYDYDPNGNVLAITDWRSQRGDRDMSYDSLDRLKTVTSDMFGTQGASYTYDILDNLTRVNIGGTKARDHFYCYDSRRRLTSVRTVGCPTDSGTTVIGLDYDDQGNLENKNGQLFDFDFGNRLREGTDVDELTKKETYQYDAHGRRVLASAANGDIRSQYGQDGVLRYQQDDRVDKAFNYFYLGGRLVAIRETPFGTTNHTIKFQHTDALGSPVAVTAANRTVLERSEYEPFGLVLAPSAPGDGPGYTGHVLDAATGLNYMQQRYYDPGIGRFLSVDPVTADGNSGSNFNRYWYANNNPYRFTDPDGRLTKEDVANFFKGVGKALFDGTAEDAHYSSVNPSVVEVYPGELSMAGQCGCDYQSPFSAPATNEEEFGRDAAPAFAVLLGIVTKRPTAAFKHNYKYAARVRQRGVQDPSSHNFPYSFDDEILATTPILKKNGYRIYQQRGSMAGKVKWDPATGARTQTYKDGVFEIGVTKDGTIDHRFFKPDN